MPNRIIRDGICSSESINALTADQEVLFYRLLVICDDFGRFDGRLPIVKAAAFPLREVSAKNLEAWLAALERQTLIVRYQVDGKPFLAVAKWDQHQRIRNARSRYPAPVVDDPPSLDGESRSIDSKSPTVAARAGAESESESNPNPNPNPNPSAAAPPGVWQQTWDAWVRHKGRKQTADADRLQRKHLAEWLASGHDPNAIVEAAVAGGWAGLHPPNGAASRREQQARNIDILTGKANGRRQIDGVAERVGEPAVFALPCGLRKPRADDVEGREPGPSERVVGG